jgi:hypothetical protein
VLRVAISTRSFAFVLLAGLTLGTLIPSNAAAQPVGSHQPTGAGNDAAFTPRITSHFRRVLASGVDGYGPRKTALWVSSVDVRQGGLPKHPDPKHRRWYRDIHSPRGSNLYWDQPLIVAAYALSEQTGDRRYAAAADRYVQDFLKLCVAKETGLFLWGNHIYYDVVEDKVVGFSGGHHELRPHAPAWDVFWRIDPAATKRQIQAMFDQHVRNKSTGRFCRHASTSKPVRGSSSTGMPFLEAGAVLVESLAWLAQADEQNAAKYTDQALLVARYSFSQRNPHTGLLRNQPGDKRWDYFASTSEVGLWAGALLRAADYTKNPAFEEMADKALRAWVDRAWDEEAGRYCGQLDVETGRPVRHNSYDYPYMPRYHAEIFEPNQGPTHNYPLPAAEACLTLFQKTGDEIFKTAAQRWVKHNENSLPARGDGGNRPCAPRYAGEYGRVIHFLVRAADVLKTEEHRELARKVADDAVRELYVEKHGMFRTHFGEDRTEAVDGLGVLFLALMYLETGEEPHPPGLSF